MILQTEVAPLVATTGLAFEDVDDLVVKDDTDVVTGGDDFVGIPFSHESTDINGGLGFVDRANRLNSGLGSSDLDFVSLLDGDPGVIAGVGEADEDPGVLLGVGGFELQLEIGVGVIFFAIPPESHAPFCGGDVTFDFE